MIELAKQAKIITQITLNMSMWAAVSVGLIGVIKLSPQAYNIRPEAVPKDICVPSKLYIYDGSNNRIITIAEMQDTIILTRNTTLSQQICKTGTLRLMARGTPAEGIDAQITVAIASTTLLTTEVSTESIIKLRVAQAGLLTITFGNDQNRPDLTPPEDRNVFIRELKFTPDP